MRKSRFTEEQIIAALKAAEAGQKVADLCRKHGITEQTFYRWRSKYGGLDVSDARKLYRSYSPCASHNYCATKPPSTGIALPVTNEAASEHNHTTASATSSGLPILPIGSIAMRPASASVPSRGSTIGVRMTPGHTAFTRIPALA
jgi:putative transposase